MCFLEILWFYDGQQVCTRSGWENAMPNRGKPLSNTRSSGSSRLGRILDNDLHWGWDVLCTKKIPNRTRWTPTRTFWYELVKDASRVSDCIDQ